MLKLSLSFKRTLYAFHSNKNEYYFVLCILSKLYFDYLFLNPTFQLFTV